ncbi:uncharacterized protein LOC125034711 [Penaeus chinensis]|uniref:uncharacterized protein LOC125034711 n=1 Tax=Penaeus chinensis TaxID=139456 RepID=UPI001FB5B201|nr:uncharacterized protein LOC125034711 [Penaeus chinensis]
MKICLALLAVALVGTSCAETVGSYSGCRPGDSSCTVAVARTRCSGGPCGSAAAESTTFGDDGVADGECAYTDQQGRSVRIRFRQLPNGQTYAQANIPVRDAQRELRACRQEAARARETAMREHNRMMREHQRLQEEMFRQHQTIVNQISAPFANLPIYK